MWILLSLISAFGMAARIAIAKDISHKFKAIFQTMLMAATSLIFFIPYAIFTYEGIPFSTAAFIIPAVISSATFLTANALILKASEISPISLTVPFLAISPIFAIIIEFLIAGALPTLYGTIGIFLVVIGAYTLNASECRKGCLEPFKAISKEKGVMLAIFSAFFFAIGGTLQKYAIEESSITAFILVWTVCVSIFGLILSPILEGNFVPQIKKSFNPKLISTGFLFALAFVTYSIALEAVNASYVLSLKRTVALFGVLIGWLIFKEVKIKERLVGATIMVTGVILISVLG